jgi:low affinity Fe/Cu permease
MCVKFIVIFSLIDPLLGWGGFFQVFMQKGVDNIFFLHSLLVQGFMSHKRAKSAINIAKLVFLSYQ